MFCESRDSLKRVGELGAISLDVYFKDCSNSFVSGFTSFSLDNVETLGGLPLRPFSFWFDSVTISSEKSDKIIDLKID